VERETDNHLKLILGDATFITIDYDFAMLVIFLRWSAVHEKSHIMKPKLVKCHWWSNKVF